MRRQDKKKHMEKVNKLFQERAIPKEEKSVEYTVVPDFLPELSKILK